MKAARLLQEVPAHGRQLAAVTQASSPGTSADSETMRVSQATFLASSWVLGVCVGGGGWVQRSLAWEYPLHFSEYGSHVFSISFSVRVSWDPLVPQNVSFFFRVADFCSFQWSTFHILLDILVSWLDTCLPKVL